MAEALTDLLRDLFGNVFLAASGGAALVFLFRREFVRFAEFVVLAVLVATFVYFPEMWIAVAEAVAERVGEAGGEVAGGAGGEVTGGTGGTGGAAGGSGGSG